MLSVYQHHIALQRAVIEGVSSTGCPKIMRPKSVRAGNDGVTGLCRQNSRLSEVHSYGCAGHVLRYRPVVPYTFWPASLLMHALLYHPGDTAPPSCCICRLVTPKGVYDRRVIAYGTAGLHGQAVPLPGGSAAPFLSSTAHSQIGMLPRALIARRRRAIAPKPLWETKHTLSHVS